MPIIPETHQKYNLLPKCVEYDGDAIYYPTAEQRAIANQIPNNELTIPYFHTLAEYNGKLDACIQKYGMANGKHNDLGKMLVEYKKRISEMNVKENWSVLRYIGETCCSLDEDIDGLTQNRHYYMAGWYVIGSENYMEIFDNEEYIANAYFPDKLEWEIAEDPTGMAASLFAEANNRTSNM